MKKSSDLNFFSFWLISLLILSSCSSSEPFFSSVELEMEKTEQTYENADTLHTFLLIGDTGDPVLGMPDPVLSTLHHHLERDSSRSSVIFLGDNIYSSGMPPDPTHKERKHSEEKISAALSTLEPLVPPSYFIPGNHDWRYGQKGLKAQEAFVENYSGIKTVMEPSNGCPGPFHTVVKNRWLMIAVDSQWLIKQRHSAALDLSLCKFKTYDEVMSEVESIVANHSDKQLLVLTHHPLYSNGPHGGYFTLKDHIFPLTNLQSWIYLPLPVLGTVYPVYRKVGNSSQDISNEAYQKYKKDILEVTSDADERIFASGHEHSLALFDQSDHLAIVSGSGSKKSYTKHGEGADFAFSDYGFAKLISFHNGDFAIEFWVTSDQSEKGKRVFAKRFKKKEYNIKDSSDYQVSTDANNQEKRKITPGSIYKAGGLKKTIWGTHYRDVWTTPVEMDALNLNEYDILSIGGGQQSVSIVVEDSTGNRSIIRSVQKDPSKALPEVMRQTFAKDIIQDQISASHPYGALVVAPLAKAAGVYQTSPKIRYIPKDSGLPLPAGGANAGVPVLMEEFVSVAWFQDSTNKKAENILSTNNVWMKLREDDRYDINQEQLLRSRIFDMFIGDWDRHDGQWFWAEVETDDGILFEPIPIDRDNAFFKSDGLIPRLASRRWALRKFQHFGNDIRDIKGINFNAMHFDRWFLTKLDLEEWLRIAKELENSLTDQVVENAVRKLPEAAYKLSGQEMAEKLKVRRAKIQDFAERYYNVFSKEVNIFGSKESDIFDIERFENGNVRVTLYNEVKSNKKQYERLFRTEETDEIRLYGFHSDDQFILSGPDHDGILIRLIPGEGRDVFEDRVTGARRNTNVLVYDTYDGLQSNISKATNIQYSNDRKVHRYHREAFKYNFTTPLLTGGFNQDDGVFLGGGIQYVRHGFRKSPYKSMHKLSAKHSLLTSAFSMNSTNYFTEAVGSLDIEIDLEVLAPNYKANYFGLGNETKRQTNNRSFYRFRMDQVHLKTSFQKRISSITQFKIGSQYTYFKPSETAGRFISSSESELSPEDFQGHHFGVIASSFEVNSVDNEVSPYYGFRFRTSAMFNLGIDNNSESFARLGSEGTLYYTFEELNSTLGFRIGVVSNIGDFNFFQANTLGGNTLLGDHGRLRGFPRDRFAGRTAFYHNLDLRTKLFDFQSYLFPATVGILGFYDNGRVWLDNEHSNRWHQGYGGGIWISPFRRVVLTTTYSLSDDDQLFSINFGFNF